MSYNKNEYQFQPQAMESKTKRDFDLLADKLIELIGSSKDLTNRLNYLNLRFYGPRPTTDSSITKEIKNGDEPVLSTLHNAIGILLSEISLQHSIACELEKL